MKYTVDTIAIKKLMVENGFDTIGKLAEEADVSSNTVSGVINGKIRPSTAVMDKLIIALKMKPREAGAVFFKPDLRNT